MAVFQRIQEATLLMVWGCPTTLHIEARNRYSPFPQTESHKTMVMSKKNLIKKRASACHQIKFHLQTIVEKSTHQTFTTQEEVPRSLLSLHQ
jgi:hypothetical protein